MRTPYVGANASLVRGFITAPIEHSVAAADGIDFIESQSVQGLSTIGVRLKLNSDAAAALSDISARVNQVRARRSPARGGGPRGISLEPSDAQVASMYLSFRSSILADNQVSDYLLRVVQPRLAAVECSARNPGGGRTFAVRAWLKPNGMAALGITPTMVRGALAANNFLAAVGQTKGSLIQVNVTASTDLDSVEQFKRVVIRSDPDSVVRLEQIADVEMGADFYEQDVRFSGERRSSWASGSCPETQLATRRHQARARRDGRG